MSLSKHAVNEMMRRREEQTLADYRVREKRRSKESAEVLLCRVCSSVVYPIERKDATVQNTVWKLLEYLKAIAENETNGGAP